MEMELYANLVSAAPQAGQPDDRRGHRPHRARRPALRELRAQPAAAPRRPCRSDRANELREELANRTTGGIYFTTLQKFGRSKDERDAGLDHPLLSDRRNIIVIVDEAHRSHYDDLDGYARHLKDALPTPRSSPSPARRSRSRPQHPRGLRRLHRHLRPVPRGRGRRHGAGVLRAAADQGRPRATGSTEEDLDEAADEATVGLDDIERAQIEQSVAVVNAVYGARQRIARSGRRTSSPTGRTRREMMHRSSGPGKAMIVGGTREICAGPVPAIVELRPDWHTDADRQGPDQGRLLRASARRAAGRPSTCAATRRTRRSRSGCGTSTTSSRSSSSRT